MKRVPLAALPIVGALALGLTSSMAFAECKDLVLRMQDSSGKTKGREITAFFNCHGGSYDFPEATTLNFFEWKNGQLCHGHRVCGNVKYWKGSFGVGATWVWGSTLTDFTQNTDFINNITRLADGSDGVAGGTGGAGGNGGTAVSVPITRQDAHGNLCINARSDRAYYHTDAYADADNDSNTRCVDRRSFKLGDFCKARIGFGGGHGNPHPGPMSLTNILETETDICSPSYNSNGNDFYCFGGKNAQFAAASTWVQNNHNANQIIKGCNGDVSNRVDSSANANGGNGGNGGNSASGFSPVFGTGSGASNTNGSFDTGYDETSVNVFFSFDFGNIQRYCSGLQDEVCF